MSYYNPYQSSQGWGTSQYRFGPPPAPNFQPQPSWGGLDYYRAWAPNSDPSVFNRAFNRVHEYGNGFGPGVRMNEARHWHRKGYGGLGEISQMLPDEIGHAAAYEAYRIWIHNSSIYEPLSGDMERQRDGLIGLAIAEATKLLAYTGRPMDQYGRMAASEAAAATASYIFTQWREGEGEYGGERYGRTRTRSRHGSFSGYGGSSPYSGSSMGGDMYGSYGSGGSPHMPSFGGRSEFDPYEYDNALHGSRSSRRRRHSSASRPVIIPTAGYQGGINTVPMPGSAYGGMSGAYPPYGGGYPGSYPAIAPSIPIGSGYGGSPYGGSSYGGSSYGGVPVPPGSQVIVHHSSKPRKHRSSSRHGRRRSSSIVIPGAYGGHAGSYY